LTTAAQAFRDARRIDARFLAECHRLAEHGGADADDELVDHLGGQARADRSAL